MPFSEAMEKYGSDKPDLRIPLQLVEIKDLMDEVEFKVFAGPAKDPKGRVTALNVPGAGENFPASRSTITPNLSAFTAPKALPISK